MDFISNIGAFIPLIVGTIFFVIGMVMVLETRRFRVHGKRVNGIVVAIEQYISTTTRNGSRSEGTYYRPIVEYVYRGETYKTASSVGSSALRHQIKQKVDVFILESQNPDMPFRARVADGANIFMGAVFAALGGGALLVFHFLAGGSASIAMFFFLLGLSASFVIARAIHSGAFRGITGDGSFEAKPGSVLIETQGDYMEAAGKNRLAEYIVSLIALMVGGGILYWGISQFMHPPFSAAEIQGALNDPLGFIRTLIAGDLPSKWEDPLIITGMGAFFFLAGLFSYFHTHRKYSKQARL